MEHHSVGSDKAADDQTIFVIDDDELVRGTLRNLLTSSRFKVETFANAIGFLTSKKAKHGDCVIIDVQMPLMNGIELQRELVRQQILLPVIILTGHANVHLAVESMKEGAFDFIEKPFDPETLKASVIRALAHARDLRSRVTEAQEARKLIARLTDREREVFGYLVDGRSNKNIAHMLQISPRTVEVHRSRIQEKLQVFGLADLVRIAKAAAGDM